MILLKQKVKNAKEQGKQRLEGKIILFKMEIFVTLNLENKINNLSQGFSIMAVPRTPNPLVKVRIL